MLKEQTEHHNPCRRKIMFPLLRHSGKSKQPRPASLRSTYKPDDTHNSETPDSKQRRTGSQGKQVKINNNPSHSDMIFLKKCYQHVCIQNICLNKQLQTKEEQLRNLESELERMKVRKKKVQNIEFESFGKIEMVVSAESEDECSLQINETENTKNEINNLKQELQSLELTRFDRLRNRRLSNSKNY